jgi:hypothetical protein
MKGMGKDKEQGYYHFLSSVLVTLKIKSFGVKTKPSTANTVMA